jgi:acyl-CoA reductase-like NAD-dependent aldehyde dehydrogenase
MSESTLCSTKTALPQFRDVMCPYDGSVVGAVPLTEATAGKAVIETARVGARKAGALSRNARGKILDGAATQIEQRSEEFAQTIVSEAGKTIRQARKEVLRAVNTLRLSAAEHAGTQAKSSPLTRMKDQRTAPDGTHANHWASLPPSLLSTTRSTWWHTRSARQSPEETP